MKPIYTSQHTKNLNQNFIRKDQEFRFRCTQCGEWCRNKAPQDRILLSTVDLYRAANILGNDIQDVIAQSCEMVPGQESMIPLVVMKQRLDGSCTFLKKGKCTIHENKPLVCAMYPLGRLSFLDEDTGSYTFQYYLKDYQKEGCHGAADEIWTAEKWLARFNVEQYDECIRLYRQLGEDCSRLMHACKTDDEKREMFSTAFYMIFVKYDRSQPLREQMEMNLAFVRGLKPELFF